MCKTLEKSLKGMQGFDERAGGALLPGARPALVGIGPGCGKALFAPAFLAGGALKHGKSDVLGLSDRRGINVQVHTVSQCFNFADLPERERPRRTQPCHIAVAPALARFHSGAVKILITDIFLQDQPTLAVNVT